jgi:hypothetical protein
MALGWYFTKKPCIFFWAYSNMSGIGLKILWLAGGILLFGNVLANNKTDVRRFVAVRKMPFD